MACLHPIKTSYFDVRQNRFVSLEVPCGHCLCCREAFRRSWSFRIKKTAEASDGFIYDTLTLRPGACPVLDYSDIQDTGDLSIPGGYFPDGVPRTHNVKAGDLALLSFYNFKIPYLPRSVVSDWLRCGRERYASFHRKAIKEGKVQRLNLRYAAVLEYGPLHARPHVHIVLFGISYADYVRFFAKQWRARYGFTKTKWIKPGDRKSAGNVAGYLAKYFVKGDFVSPLVKSHLVPREWRLLSHSLGAEYLKNPRFSKLADYLCIDKKLFDLACHTSYDTGDKALVNNLSSLIFCALDCMPEGNESKLLTALTTAFDGQYPLSLPRYYKDKLLEASKKSVAYVTLSSYILACTSKRKFEEVCKYTASVLGDDLQKVRFFLLSCDDAYCYWLNRFASFTKEQVLAKAARVRVREHNTFTRNYNRITQCNNDYDG